ncbi:hypothetical protein C8R44DRAFT_855036 [Mycena epipterygia]|nr:hypothetical protein C8R44DRAFT_855036 [Mycena epipterygia]
MAGCRWLPVPGVQSRPNDKLFRYFQNGFARGARCNAGIGGEDAKGDIGYTPRSMDAWVERAEQTAQSGNRDERAAATMVNRGEGYWEQPRADEPVTGLASAPCLLQGPQARLGTITASQETHASELYARRQWSTAWHTRNSHESLIPFTRGSRTRILRPRPSGMSFRLASLEYPAPPRRKIWMCHLGESLSAATSVLLSWAHRCEPAVFLRAPRLGRCSFHRGRWFVSAGQLGTQEGNSMYSLEKEYSCVSAPPGARTNIVGTTSRSKTIPEGRRLLYLVSIPLFPCPEELDLHQAGMIGRVGSVFYRFHVTSAPDCIE